MNAIKPGIERELKVFYDRDQPNPRREFDGYGTMACFHGRYDLGDEDIPFRHADFESWDEMEAYIEGELEAVVCLPLYLLDHSGLSIRTSPYGCPFDSGQVGFIYATPAQAEAYGVESVEALRKGLMAAVEEYDSYLKGDCYGFTVRTREEGASEWEDEDSCWGFIGLEYAVEAIADHSGFTVEEVKEAFSSVS